MSLPAGVSVFYRASKRRFVLSYADAARGRPQRVLPAEVTSRRAAEAWALDYLQSSGVRPSAALAQRREEGPTVAASAAKFLAMQEADERVAPATYRSRKGHLTNHILPRFGERAVAALDVPELRAWLRELRTKVAPQTCRNVVSTFALLYAAARAEGWVKREVNVVDDEGVRAELPELDDHEPLEIPLPWAQMLIASPKVPLERRARYALAFTSGMRDGEIAGARIQDLEGVDDEALGQDAGGGSAGSHLARRERRPQPDRCGGRTGLGAVAPGRVQGGAQTSRHPGDIRDHRPEEIHIAAIRIEQAVAIVGAKGKGGFAQARPPKTRKSRRTLPVHPAAVEALRAWLASEERAALVGHRDLKPEDYLFPGPGGVAARPRSAEHLRADLKALGLPTSLDGHPVEFKATRSSFASWLEEAGVSEAIRKRLMGHVAKDVTEKHYTRRDLGRLAEAVATIALTWEGAEEHGSERAAEESVGHHAERRPQAVQVGRDDPRRGRGETGAARREETAHDSLGPCTGARDDGECGARSAGSSRGRCGAGTRPILVTAGTRNEAKCAEEQAPPAGIEPATNGLGSLQRSADIRPLIRWKAFESSAREASRKGFCASNGLLKVGRRGVFLVPGRCPLEGWAAA